MDPYRSSSLPVSSRWGITRWQKFYVRVARIFVDLRAKYSYQREYRNYERHLAEWREKYANRSTGFSLYTSPCPLPPPTRIEE